MSLERGEIGEAGKKKGGLEVKLASWKGLKIKKTIEVIAVLVDIWRVTECNSMSLKREELERFKQLKNGNRDAGED